MIAAWCGLYLYLSDCSVMEFRIPIEKLIKKTPKIVRGERTGYVKGIQNYTDITFPKLE